MDGWKKRVTEYDEKAAVDVLQVDELKVSWAGLPRSA